MHQMNSFSPIRFAALAIGALLIGGTVTSSAGNLTSLNELSTIGISSIFLGPVLFNAILAWLLYAYSRRVELQVKDINENKLLIAGLKLLGFSLLAIGIPAIISALMFSVAELEATDIKVGLMQNALTSGI